MDINEQIRIRIEELDKEIETLPARKQQEFQIEMAALTVARDELRRLLRKPEDTDERPNQTEITS